MDRAADSAIRNPRSALQVGLALVSDWFLPRLGGIELQMRDLALQLRAAGHTVEVITPVPGPEVVDGIPVHRLGVPRLPGAGIVFTAEAFRRLRQLLVGGRYDVMHVHFGIIAPAAYGATSVAQSAGIPTVATFHSVLDNFELPLAAVRALLDVRSWPVQWSAVSSVVARSLRPLVGDVPVALLPNGIDAGWWAPRGARRSPDGTVRIVSAMRLHPRKRPHALVHALRVAAAAMPPGIRVEAEIYGEGGSRRALESLIGRLGMGDRVRLMGWQPRDRLRAALHQADLFVMPSRLEAFGIAALEARCAGVPVVAMRRAGVRDFLRDGIDSVLVKDDAELERAVSWLAASLAARERLAEGSRSAPVRHDWAATIDAHLAAYASARSQIRRHAT